MDKREISILANAVANCCVGVRELHVQTEDRRYFFLRFENGKPYSWWEETAWKDPARWKELLAEQEAA